MTGAPGEKGERGFRGPAGKGETGAPGAPGGPGAPGADGKLWYAVNLCTFHFNAYNIVYYTLPDRSLIRCKEYR